MQLRSVGHCLVLAALACVLSRSEAQADRIGEEDRRSFAQFRKEEGLSKQRFRQLFGGAARIVCRWRKGPVTGSAAIIQPGNVFVTADHLFLDRKARPHGPVSKCRVQTLVDGRTYRIRRNSVLHGYRTGSTPSVAASRDWAVGELTRPARIPEPFPVRMDDAPPEGGTGVLLITQGHVGWGPFRPSIGRCKVLDFPHHLFATDCDFHQGGSGGPVLALDPALTQTPALLGIATLLRRHPPEERKYYDGLHSSMHAVSLVGGFLDAIRRFQPPHPRPKPFVDLALTADQQVARGIAAHEKGRYREARRWWLWPARHRHASAAYLLARLHERGEGRDPNRKEAVRWYKIAAQGDHAAAQERLAKLYLDQGRTIEGLKWWFILEGNEAAGADQRRMALSAITAFRKKADAATRARIGIAKRSARLWQARQER
ncbi:MAG: bifunctional trypsin-like peptidase domain-containing/SEL1-like repeat protein [Pseudomonadota bacterium]